MESLFTAIFGIFSLEYMFVVIIASYFVLKVIDKLNGDYTIPTWLKRLTTIAVGVAVAYAFWVFGEDNFQKLSASFFAAVFCYDAAIKYLIQKFNIDYKKDAK